MRFDIPLDPDGETARQWVRDELTKQEYAGGGKTILQRIYEWVQELLNRASGANGPDLGGPWGVIGIALATIAVIAGIVYLVMGPLRLSRRRKASSEIFGEDDAPAKDLRALAEAAAAKGDWEAAFIERFRALVRGADESGKVSVVPGLTAYEFAQAAGKAMRRLAPEFTWAADTFDLLRYGHAGVTASDYTRITALDVAARTAPVEVAS